VETLLAVGLWNAVGAAVLAVFAACVGCVCRRPAVRHALWLLVLVKLVTPPLWPVTVPSVQPDPPAVALMQPAPIELVVEPVVQHTAVSPVEPIIEPVGVIDPAPPEMLTLHEPFVGVEPPAMPLPTLRVPWLEIVFAAWLGGALLCWSINAASILRFWRVLSRLWPAPAALQARTDRLATQLGLRRGPTVCLVAVPMSPMVWTMFGRARLLLPEPLWDRLGEAQRDLVITHELAHLRRRDHLVRLLELFVLGLYWWFPVAWWARRQVQSAAELCCDAYVVALFPEAAADYAAALVDSASYLSQSGPLPAGAMGLGPVSLLRRRITMILNGKMPERMSRSGMIGLLIAGAVILPIWPVQPAPAEPENPQVTGGDEPQAAKDLKIAAFYEATGHPGSAVFYYSAVQKRYPGTPAAEQATKRIAELRAMGQEQPGQQVVPPPPIESPLAAPTGPVLPPAAKPAIQPKTETTDDIKALTAQRQFALYHLEREEAQLKYVNQMWDQFKELAASGDMSETQINGWKQALANHLTEKSRHANTLKLIDYRLAQFRGEEPKITLPPKLARADFDLSPALKFFGDVAIDQTEYHFGKIVERGATLKHAFYLTNISDQNTFKIESLRYSASVMTGKLDQAVLEPGQTARLTIDIDTSNFSGPREFSAYLTLVDSNGWQRNAKLDLMASAYAPGDPLPAPVPLKAANQAVSAHEVEARFDAIMKEIDALRSEVKKVTGEPVPPPITVPPPPKNRVDFGNVKVDQAAAAWSKWGTLRKSSIWKDGQFMYLLEEENGVAISFAVPAPGLTLDPHLGKIVCLYGSTKYQSDGTYYTIATTVAYPMR
jgi:beta-lactamase regulating signal transducer with metallopeptidase domain